MKKPVNVQQLTKNGCFEDLNEPAVFLFGYKNRDTNDTHNYQGEVLGHLKDMGFNAVRYDSPEAADPSTMIVSPTGIQSPFMLPEEVENMALATAIEVQHCRHVDIKSHISAQTIDQMSAPLRQQHHKSHLNFNGCQHPHPEIAEQIIKKRGKNFVPEMFQEAYNSPDCMNLVQLEDKFPRKAFRGIIFAQTHKIANSREDKSFAYGARIPKIASYYTGAQKDNNNSYGFIGICKRSPTDVWVDDSGLENAKPGSSDGTQGYEGALNPRKNPSEATVMHFYKKNNETQEVENCYYQIPQNNERWQDFMALHTPSYQAPNQHMNERRITQMDQAAAHGNRPYTYDYDGVLTTPGVTIEKQKSLADPKDKKKISKNKLKLILKARGVWKGIKKAVKKSTLDNNLLKNKDKQR